MATNQITDFLKYANLQMAAEALFTHDAREGIQEPGKIEQGPLGLSNLTFGNGHASVFTPTSAAQFTPGWTVVQHKSNTATGFSGTLFRYDGPTDAAKGLTIGELVLSMRSTEFIDDSVRDNPACGVRSCIETYSSLGHGCRSMKKIAQVFEIHYATVDWSVKKRWRWMNARADPISCTSSTPFVNAKADERQRRSTASETDKVR